MNRNHQILLTGAAGRIGSTFFSAAHTRFTFRLTDLPDLAIEAESPHEFVPGDLGDAEACLSLCKGIDTVVHLAGVSSPDATFDAVLEHNIRVTHNVFLAAKEQGCKRVVVASSAQVTEAYPVDARLVAPCQCAPRTYMG